MFRGCGASDSRSAYGALEVLRIFNYPTSTPKTVISLFTHYTKKKNVVIAADIDDKMICLHA